ncbi:nucleoside diphosphate kinase homolog 5 [Lethenteron reissneri]|uniref:nucleoside diphosphate kinase homolog 5 n=1 Tax=Lethenteron reissneri TaxID=7753 RepID=UPI002AB5F3A7|nr:nucleoside diphosphate kinase homolog 5 [Lethenteron reissneri]
MSQILLPRTLAIVKPEALEAATQIRECIAQAGFTVLQCRRVHLSPEQCSELYSEHFGKMIFPSLVAYMSSGPILAMVLARHRATELWQQLMGPRNSEKARQSHPDSLRALYGTDELRNAVHGSDNPGAAEREIRFFFPDAILEPIPESPAAREYLERSVNPTLLAGLTQLCKHKPADPVVWLADWLVRNNPNKPVVTDEQQEDDEGR